MKTTNLAKSVEVNGVCFTLKDNGVQLFYTTTSDGVTYDIIQNYRESVWWVAAHKDGAVKTLNCPGSVSGIHPNAPYNLPGVLYSEGCHLQPVEYWLEVVANYIKQGNKPFSSAATAK
ncbi:hypothetical protein H6G00_01735 [Leptolyngbya sp. FACHB-541]|uniref:hypothetical protein n=1 Tax=Leptolyngbya sp. FACHB-541 TaxID=2692810 RepID=UPI001688A7AE|nr:hypothetical protein [Leptolyngbya sp. FACHB-541]MBD1995352.1 hypothetical protein [Leptolyngbya sp. FACHB-541]